MSDFKAPWSVHVDHQTSPGRFDVFSSEGHLVAVATTRERAELICAAPELLEALQDALHAHDKHGEHSEWDFARAAISKAFGQ